jgi:hypothetical protein
MTKHRLTLNEHGELLKRDGTVVGRISAISVEIDDETWGTMGEVVAVGETANVKDTTPHPSKPGEQTTLMPDAVVELYAHYQSKVKGAERRPLDAKRRRCCAAALKVRDIEVCKRAIDWLAVSPHHNGKNDRMQEYLDIKYALGLPSESPDERIDKMAAQAGSSNEPTSVGALIAHMPSDTHGYIRNEMRSASAAYKTGRRDLSAETMLREKVGIEPILETALGPTRPRVSGWKRCG